MLRCRWVHELNTCQMPPPPRPAPRHQVRPIFQIQSVLRTLKTLHPVPGWLAVVHSCTYLGNSTGRVLCTMWKLGPKVFRVHGINAAGQNLDATTADCIDCVQGRANEMAAESDDCDCDEICPRLFRLDSLQTVNLDYPNGFCSPAFIRRRYLLNLHRIYLKITRFR